MDFNWWTFIFCVKSIGKLAASWFLSDFNSQQLPTAKRFVELLLNALQFEFDNVYSDL